MTFKRLARMAAREIGCFLLALCIVAASAYVFLQLLCRAIPS